MSNVTHPSHYNSGKIEVIEAIEDWKLCYHLGNSVKYIARAGKKDPSKEIEDLEKAAWYLKRKIEKLTAAKQNREAVRPNDMNPYVGADPALPGSEKTVFSATNAFLSVRHGPHRDSAPTAIKRPCLICLKQIEPDRKYPGICYPCEISESSS